jgi:hypothetical protein
VVDKSTRTGDQRKGKKLEGAETAVKYSLEKEQFKSYNKAVAENFIPAAN